MEKKMLNMQSIISLCVIIAIGLSLFNLKSAIEYRRYNSAYVQFAAEHAGEGFIEKESAVFQYSPYRWHWTVGMESVCAQALRGATVIDCIVLGDRVSFFDEGDIGFYGNMDRYGITYDYSAFY